MALNKIFGPKRKEVSEYRRKLHSQWLCDWYTVLNMTRAIKSSRTLWAGYVTLMGENRIAYSAFMRKSEDKIHLEGIRLHSKIILNRRLRK